METLSALFFELANVDRLEILVELSKESMKLTNISKTLKLTVQETSRHLQRLSEANLLTKMVDGTYHLTNYGENILSLLPAFEFLVRHQQYFITHQIRHIPRELLSRIGDLKGSKLLDNPVNAFQHVNTIIEDAKDQISFVADQVPSGSIPLIEAAVKRGVIMQFLMPEDLGQPHIPDAYLPHYDSDDQKRLNLGRIKSVEFVGVISERAAVVGFPTTDGRMDYTAFYTESEIALRWCRDLFLHYWNQIESTHPVDQ
jgi:predicted transcriptional regulator